jgi:ubiquitin C-terminal hydrolase
MSGGSSGTKRSPVQGFLKILQSIQWNNVEQGARHVAIVPMICAQLKTSLSYGSGSGLSDALEVLSIGERWLLSAPFENAFVHQYGWELILMSIARALSLENWPAGLSNRFLKGAVSWVLKLPSTTSEEQVEMVQRLCLRTWEESREPRAYLQTCTQLFQSLLTSVKFTSPDGTSGRVGSGRLLGDRCILAVLPASSVEECYQFFSKSAAVLDATQLKNLVQNASQWAITSKTYPWVNLLIKSLSHAHRYDVLILSIPIAACTIGRTLCRSLLQMGNLDSVERAEIVGPGITLLRQMLVPHPMQSTIEKMEHTLLSLLLFAIAESSTAETILGAHRDIITLVQLVFFSFPDAKVPALQKCWNDNVLSLFHRRVLLAPAERIECVRQASWARLAHSNKRVGLDNLGNTCYLNAIIQVLFHTDEFRASVFSTTVTVPGIVANPSLKLLKATKRLFMSMLLTNRPSLCDQLKAFRKHVPPQFQTGAQQDASEFCKFFLDELVTNCKLSSTLDIFRGTICNHVQCSVCYQSSTKEDFFFELPVALPQQEDSNGATTGALNLAGLVERFSAEEQLENYFCEKCGSRSTSTKWSTIQRTPKILVISLKRFYYDAKRQSSGKISALVKVPVSIHVSGSQYEIYGAIDHHGSTITCGHYTATACHSSEAHGPQQHWYNFNDEVVTPKASRQLQGAYMLFFSKRGQEASSLYDVRRDIVPDAHRDYENLRTDNVKYMLELNRGHEARKATSYVK